MRTIHEKRDWLTGEVARHVQSTRFIDFVDKFIEDTGHRVVFNLEPSTFFDPFGSDKHCPAIIVPGEKIVICLDPKKFVVQSFEDSAVSEMTHLLMMLRDGFCEPEFKIGIDVEGWTKIVHLVMPLTGIVVESRLQEAGFSPFHNLYFWVMEQETAFLKNCVSRMDIYAKKYYWLGLYIEAHNVSKFLSIGKQHTFILDQFLSEFERTLPDFHKEAAAITKIIMAHDIFAPEGHMAAMREVIQWIGLADYVALTTKASIRSASLG